GLQRKDLHLLEHGVETGIIRQLPSGEYIEETRPVDEEARAVLESRHPAPSLPAGATVAALEEAPVPPAAMRGGMGRVREGLNAVLTESVPMDGHGGGYGGHGNGHGNGHGDGNGHAEHAAISPGGDLAPGDEEADGHAGS